MDLIPSMYHRSCLLLHFASQASVIHYLTNASVSTAKQNPFCLKGEQKTKCNIHNSISMLTAGKCTSNVINKFTKCPQKCRTSPNLYFLRGTPQPCHWIRTGRLSVSCQLYLSPYTLMVRTVFTPMQIFQRMQIPTFFVNTYGFLFMKANKKQVYVNK